MTDFYKDEWGAFYQPGLADLCRDRELTGESYRVLIAMISMMDKANEIKVRSVDVAEHLGIRPAEVARQIRRLMGKQILLPRQRYGWRLNPRYGFKGEPDASLRRQDGELVLVD